MLRAEKRNERYMSGDKTDKNKDLEETPEKDASKSSDDAKADDTDSDTAEDVPAALDELEAEELEMLTEDESDEAIVVDEAAEMRAIRRAEIAMEAGEVDEAKDDEFVCTKCFLVKPRSQLAKSRKKICKDCAS